MLADKPLISPIRIVDTASGAISYNTVFMRILFSKISNVSLVLLLDVLIINELSLTGITSDEADLITYSEFSSVPVRLILLSGINQEERCGSLAVALENSIALLADLGAVGLQATKNHEIAIVHYLTAMT